MKITKFCFALTMACAIACSGARSFARTAKSLSAIRVVKPKSDLSLSVVSVGAQEIRLAWQNRSREVVYFYDIYRSKSPNFLVPSTHGVDIFDVFDVKKSLAFNDSELKPQTTYYYRVVTRSRSGLLMVSNLVAVKTKPLPIPPKLQPIVLKLDGISPLREVTLSWTPYKSKDFSYTNIYGSLVANFKPDEKNLLEQLEKPTQTHFKDDGIAMAATLSTIMPEQMDKANTLAANLVFPKSLYYKVIVYNWDGRKSVSNELAVNLPIPSTKLPQPALLTASSVFNKRATLQWTPNKEPDFINYQLHRSTQKGFTPSRQTNISLLKAVGTTFEDRDLQPQTKYFYKVVTFNIDGLSSQSNELEVETSAPPSPKLAPAPVVLKLGAPPTFDTVSLQWTKSNDPNFDSYELSQLEKPNDSIPERATDAVFGATDTTWIDEELQEGTTYYYVLVVRNKFDQTTASNVVTVTTRQHTARPITLKAAADEGYYAISTKPNAMQTKTKVAPELLVNLSWTGQSSDDAGSYIIYRGDNPHFKPAETSKIATFGASEASWEDRKVEAGRIYFYKIIYVANNGQTFTSNEAKVIVPVLNKTK